MYLSILLATFISIMSVSGAMAARGTVFHDKNQNGQKDEGEPGIKNFGVSNGKEVTETNDQGIWELPHDEDTIFFVIKPRDWSAPLNKHNLPQFYYIHKPEGSPAKLKYKGLEPTGPLPESIDFALSQKKEPDTFKAIFFVNILNYLFTPFMFEVNINVGRFITCSANKPFKQKFNLGRVNSCDA